MSDLQALRFYGSSDVTVTGITIQNSQQTHLKLDSCTNVQVYGITVSSPGNSPNTDGIHLQNSKDVLIYNANLACGNSSIQEQNIHLSLRPKEMRDIKPRSTLFEILF